MQRSDDLFADDPAARPERPAARRPARPASAIVPVPPTPELAALGHGLDPRVHLGTSSWYFPGWQGLVFGGKHTAQALARGGLQAYGQHPLLRTVSLDRSFYRPLPTAEYAALAAQVPVDFRFVVKAGSAVTDAALREPGTGRVVGLNPLFLDPQTTLDTVYRPAVEGLAGKLGVLVFQLSPLPRAWLAEPRRLLDALARLFAALPNPAPALLALELRDAGLLTPELAAMLKACGVRYCLALHDRMPAIDAQLPLLRAQWPGPLVCRWTLHQGLGYGQAVRRFEPFDRLAAPDPDTRAVLARVIAATVAAGQPVFVTINNKAEGSAVLSVVELARQLAADAAAAVP